MDFDRPTRSGLDPSPAPPVSSVREARAKATPILYGILEATSDFVGIASADGRPLYLNRAGRAMLGIGETEELPDVHVASFVAAPVRETFLRKIRPAALRDGIWRGENLFQFRNPEPVPVSQVIVACKDEHGRVELLSTFGRDITEQKRAREALQRSAHLFRTLSQMAPVGIFRNAPDGACTYANQRCLELVGMRMEEAAGSGWLEALHPQDRHRVQTAWERSLRTRARFKEEYRFRRPDGSESWVIGEVLPLEADGGRLEGFVGTLVDITERKRAEVQRASLEQQLRHSQKMEAVGRLAGGVAHDFNNLLSVILGQSELMLGRLPPSDPAREGLEAICIAGERAITLTRQLLAFSRKQVLEPRVLDLNRIVTEMDAMLRRLIGEDIELVAAPAPDLGLVRADPGQIAQVLVNLAVNARDAMPGGGRLIVETANAGLDAAGARRRPEARAGPHVMLAVSDTGVGMDAETRARIFEPFFTTREQGTGLGLATVYGIVKQSGGWVEVDSKPGQGTTFRIYLPRAAGGAGPAQGPSASRPEPLGGRETILVVEDESSVREVAEQVLRAGGYRVLAAGHAEEAIALLRAHEDPVHLLLTDVVMPGMSGGDLARRLTAEHPGMKVLYMSGYTDDATVHHDILGAGAALLSKPLRPRSLLARVREVLA